MKKILPVLLISFLLITGCAHKVVFMHENVAKITKVAVLPFANETNDLDGSAVFRKLFFDGLCRKGYIVLPLDQVDKKLNELGITQGGQLNSISQEELMKELDAPALVYGTLNKCAYVTAAIYRKKEVAGTVKIYYKGELFWEDTRQIKEDEVMKGNILKNLGDQLVDKIVDKAIAGALKIHPLQPQFERMTNILLISVPGK
ncbi:MAG: DUF799 family lipoprotein [bacterium]|nr:DUF799 family lipoprotein [bacterium]